MLVGLNGESVAYRKFDAPSQLNRRVVVTIGVEVLLHIAQIGSVGGNSIVVLLGLASPASSIWLHRLGGWIGSINCDLQQNSKIPFCCISLQSDQLNVIVLLGSSGLTTSTGSVQ